MNATVPPNVYQGDSMEKDVSLEGVRLPNSVRKQLRKTRDTLKRKKEGSLEGGGTGTTSGTKSGVRRKKNKTIHKIGLRGVFTEPPNRAHKHSSRNDTPTPSSTTSLNAPQLLRKIKSPTASSPATPPSTHLSTPPSTPALVPPSTPAKRPPSKGILKTSGRATTRKRVRFQDESGAIMPTPFPIPKRLRFTQKRRVHGDDDEPIKLNPIIPRERTLQIVNGGGGEGEEDDVSVEGEGPEIMGETLDIEDVLADAEEIPREELQSRLRKRGVYVQSSTPPDLLKRLNVITADVPEGGIQRTG